MPGETGGKTDGETEGRTGKRRDRSNVRRARQKDGGTYRVRDKEREKGEYHFRTS